MHLFRNPVTPVRRHHACLRPSVWELHTPAYGLLGGEFPDILLDCNFITKRLGIFRAKINGIRNTLPPLHPLVLCERLPSAPSDRLAASLVFGRLSDEKEA